MTIQKTACGDFMAKYRGIIAYAKKPELAIIQLMLKL
jgi:hypothetical protein